ncbi:MAG: phosphoribosylformimino-5-aminoimidazole carboxamide ribotide isomerase [Gaiellaceae bacterium]|nr:phosphoribosylformimino-5-aminoimidazole carboxamide ribotide isomerase [Gaiellaceae bacterium]
MLARQNFTIYPAIDVLEGRVVRLSEGRREAVTVEGGDPVAAAERFVAEGASWLHLVDLDGAFSGEPDLDLVRRIAAAGLPVQVGGGYRDLDSVGAALAAGAARVLVGTAALDVEFLSAAASRFEDRVVVAIDARDGAVTVQGWTQSAGLAPAELARRCAAAGIRRVLVTSAQRDGTLSGPDVQLLESVLEAGLPVIAAGGIATLDDLRLLRGLGCEGAVSGSAIWLDRFSLADALALELERA